MLTLSINATCILLYLSKAIYIYVEFINLSVQELFSGELFQALISLPETKKSVIPFLRISLFASLSIRALYIPTSEISQTWSNIHP
jgi:hypothetical protein